MRMSLLLIAGVGIATVAACSGLTPEADCTQYGTCPVDGGTSSSGDAGFDVVAPPGCDLTKSPKDSPECVDGAVGVFVAPNGDDSGAGTKSLPFKTIAKGVEAAAAKGLPRVYVCEGTYDTNVELKAPVSIYGGLSCAWSYTGAKPKLAPPKGIALRVTKVSGAVLVEDMEIVGSADAATPGDSAIAVFASESGNVTLRNDAVSAGPGVAGMKGASRSNYTTAAAGGGNANGAVAGAGATCSCTDGSSSKGGNGAAGNGADVSAGSAMPTVGTANSGFSNLTSCGDGDVGANGAANGAGAEMKLPGAASAAGWTSDAAPVAAPNGNPAQGGGGGGAKTQGGTNAGGGGGCGGCGGAGGESGMNGGSSFAVLSFGSTVSVDGGVIASGAGATGGPGGDGQPGQQGGGVGTGACNGGPGGNGAGGSGGGGGAGGHSAPIAFVGTEPRVTGATLTPGAKGASGGGGQPGAGPGNAGAAGTPGAEGKSQNVLAL